MVNAKGCTKSKLHRSATIAVRVIEIMDKLRDKRRQLYALPNDHRTWNTKQRKLADYIPEASCDEPRTIEEGVFQWRHLAFSNKNEH